MSLSYVTFLWLKRLFCPGFVYVTYYRVLSSEIEGPHYIHSLRSSCFIKKSAFNVVGNLVTVVKFTFQSVVGNSRRNPRHFSARGREESLELYSILWSDWPTSKQEVLRHGNRFAARVRRRYFSEGEKQRPEIRLLFAGYYLTATADSIIWNEHRAKDGFVVSHHVLLSHHRRAGSRDFSRAWHL